MILPSPLLFLSSSSYNGCTMLQSKRANFLVLIFSVIFKKPTKRAYFGIMGVDIKYLYGSLVPRPSHPSICHLQY